MSQDCSLKRPLEDAHIDENVANRPRIDEGCYDSNSLKDKVILATESLDKERYSQILGNVGLRDENTTRLEVLWSLETNDGTTDMWWPCKLDRYGSKLKDGRFAFTITYDACQSFEESKSDVIFLNGSSLYDTAEEAVMHWRIEGVESFDEDRIGEVMSLDDIVGQEEDETEQDPLFELMKNLPMIQQQKIALSYRDMVEKLMEKLQELKQEKDRNGSDHIVTAEDMHSIIANLSHFSDVQNLSDAV